MSKFKRYFTSLFLLSALVLTGCGSGGGGGGSSSGSGSSGTAASTGALIDGPVAGISYQTATQNGVTDGQGNYKYLPGETVTFMIGGIKLFSALATGLVNPKDAIGFDDTAKLNLARLLQSLDKDGYPGNGIEIASGLTGLPANLFTSLNFDADASAFLTQANMAGHIPSATLVSGAVAQAHLDNMNSIVGSWYFSDPSDPSAITFLADGTYLMAETGTPDATGHPGMELGTYTYNAGTGAFSNTCPTVDTSGEWGLSHGTPGVCSGSQFTVTISGNTATFTDAGDTFTLTRVIDATKSLVGSWYFSDPSDPSAKAALTFLANGTYLMAETGTPDSTGHPGMELGTYTYIAGVLTSTCPSVDTSGEWGLSHGTPGVCSGTQFTINITGNTANTSLVDDNGKPITFKRVDSVGGLIAITCTGAGTTGTGNPSSIVGSWFGASADDPKDLTVITFFSDHTYIMANDVDVVKHPTELVGMERGTYTWDANGLFTPTVTVDTNGQAGFNFLTSNLCVEVNGDKLTVRDRDKTDNIDEVNEATRVADVAGSIVGSWASGDRTKADDLAVFTFFSDGTYMQADDYINDATGHDGMERGTYTWDASSGVFTHTTTVNTDGEFGLSDDPGCNNVKVDANVMTLTCDGVPFIHNRIP